MRISKSVRQFGRHIISFDHDISETSVGFIDEFFGVN